MRRRGRRNLNVLDAGLLPYDHFHGSTPARPGRRVDRLRAAAQRSRLRQRTPLTSSRANAPDSFDSEPVNFLTTFNSTVQPVGRVPTGRWRRHLAAALNLQLWGLPTSAPAQDPNNHDFITSASSAA